MRNWITLFILFIATLSAVAFAQNPAPVKATPFALSEDYPYEDVEVMMPDTVLVHGRLYDPSQLIVKPTSSASDDEEKK